MVARAKDQYVWDADGNQYLDFFGGIVTVSVGHCNDQVNAKVHAADRYAAARLHRLRQRAAGRAGARRSRHHAGRQADEIVLHQQRHRSQRDRHPGRALLHRQHRDRRAAPLLSRPLGAWRWRSPARAPGGSGRRRPGIVHAHNAYCYRCPFGLTYPSCEVRCAQDMEELIRTTTSGRSRASSREPIQGVGGFITPPKEYFQIVEKIVRNHGGIFISDEVQTGWGRTGGKWFGIEQWGVTPDIITSAKGLGNGVPIGLTVAKPEVADSVKGAHHLHLRRQSRDHHRGQSGASTSSKSRTCMTNCAETGGYLRGKLEELQGEARAHRRRARHGPDAGHRTGGRPQDEDAGRRADRDGDGSGARERPADRQGRHVRQRASASRRR